MMGDENLGESQAVDLTGKIMVVVIIIMFFVVVIALCLHLWARNFWWRPSRFVFSSVEEGGLGREGLDPAVLASLPVLVFKGHDLKDGVGVECAVCLSGVMEGEEARFLPKCNHAFHVACIDMWFQSHSTCPLCRNPVSSSQDDQASQPALHGTTLVIHIPSHTSSSAEHDLKSPLTGSLRSLKTLFTKDATLNHASASSSSSSSLDLQHPPSLIQQFQ